MSKKILFVIASEWFQDTEYAEPRRILEENSCDVKVASDKKWKCIWTFWIETVAEYDINEIDTKNYDLVVLVWWSWAWNTFHNNEVYLNIAKNAKKLWAICIAPTIVSFSWIYNWKKVTWWDNWWEQKSIIESNWWIFTWEEVTRDWNFVTANWPVAATKFWKKLLELLED